MPINESLAITKTWHYTLQSSMENDSIDREIVLNPREIAESRTFPNADKQLEMKQQRSHSNTRQTHDEISDLYYQNKQITAFP